MLANMCSGILPTNLKGFRELVISTWGRQGLDMHLTDKHPPIFLVDEFRGLIWSGL